MRESLFAGCERERGRTHASSLCDTHIISEIHVDRESAIVIINEIRRIPTSMLRYLTQPVLRRAGARSHDFVVAVAFVHPSCTSPRDPNSIPRPHNAELSPFWKIGRHPSLSFVPRPSLPVPAHMFGDPERQVKSSVGTRQGRT